MGTFLEFSYGVSKNRGTPKMDNTIKTDDLGVSKNLSETSIVLVDVLSKKKRPWV